MSGDEVIQPTTMPDEAGKLMSDMLGVQHDASGKYLFLYSVYSSKNPYVVAATSNITTPQEKASILEAYKIVQNWAWINTPRDEFSIQDMINSKMAEIAFELRLNTSQDAMGLQAAITEKKEFTQRAAGQPGRRRVIALMRK